MTLFLLESNDLAFASNKSDLEKKAAELTTGSVPTLIEVQATEDLTHGYFIVEANNETEAKQFLEDASININLVKEVRLVGKELDEVKAGDPKIDYLVTWNIPEGITMDQYLARKKKNSVHYEEVPEVQFQRTYVCEDMTKCICLYDAPDEDAVRRARKGEDAAGDGIEKI